MKKVVCSIEYKQEVSDILLLYMEAHSKNVRDVQKVSRKSDSPLKIITLFENLCN